MRWGLEGAPEGLALLPREERVLQLSERGGDVILAGLHALDDVVYWTRWRLADLPNDLIGVEDLERVGIAGHRV